MQFEHRVQLAPTLIKIQSLSQKKKKKIQSLCQKNKKRYFKNHLAIIKIQSLSQKLKIKAQIDSNLHPAIKTTI